MADDKKYYESVAGLAKFPFNSYFPGEKLKVH